jgi:Tol biopolymer transport system component
MRLWPFLLGAGLLAAVALASFSLGKKAEKAEPPSFRQLTFRRGTISSARFAPDGQTVLYGASLEGNPKEIFVSRPESPESRLFGMPGASVLAVSKSGELALSLGQHVVAAFTSSGTLARASVAGGAAPREILEDVQWADWSPDGASLAIVRESGGRNRLEYPIGKVLFETAGWISHPRISPRGEEVAYIDHPARGDDGGSIAVVGGSGKSRKLSEPFETAQGLAWTPAGDEVWFTAAKSGANRALYGVSLSGKQRLLARVTGILMLHDVSRDGRVLMTHDVNRRGMLGLSPGEQKEHDLSWLDWSLSGDISADGKTLLFSEAGEGGGAGYSVYVRRTDGSPAVRLGEGTAQALSPDGRWALAITHAASEPQIVLYPTGAGETRTLPREGLVAQAAHWLPDGKQILMTASEPGHGARLYLWDLSGGKPRAISPEGYRSFPRPVSPDGKLVAVRGPDQRLYLYPLAGGEPSAIPGLTPEDTPTAWSADGRFLYVYRRRELPAKVYRLDVTTGRKELWKELMPADAAGVLNISPPLVTPDGKSYAYSYGRTLSDLYLVEGLK